MVYKGKRLIDHKTVRSPNSRSAVQPPAKAQGEQNMETSKLKVLEEDRSVYIISSFDPVLNCNMYFLVDYDDCILYSYDIIDAKMFLGFNQAKIFMDLVSKSFEYFDLKLQRMYVTIKTKGEILSF